jgi:hypothetical protein
VHRDVAIYIAYLTSCVELNAIFRGGAVVVAGGGGAKYHFEMIMFLLLATAVAASEIVNSWTGYDILCVRFELSKKYE